MAGLVLDPDLVTDVLREALSGGGRLAEIFAETRASTSIRLDDGRIEEVVSGSDHGAGRLRCCASYALKHPEA